MFISIRSLIVTAVCVLALGVVVAAPSPVFAASTVETVDNPLPVVTENPVRSLARPAVPYLGSMAFRGQPSLALMEGSSAAAISTPDVGSAPSSPAENATTVAAPSTAECAATATIDWGDEELTGELYSDTCVTVSIPYLKIIECSWCACGYIVKTPGGSHYTFQDTSNGGGLECGLDSPVTFH